MLKLAMQLGAAASLGAAATLANAQSGAVQRVTLEARRQTRTSDN